MLFLEINQAVFGQPLKAKLGKVYHTGAQLDTIIGGGGVYSYIHVHIQ